MNKEKHNKRAKMLKKMILQEKYQTKFDEFMSSKVAYNNAINFIRSQKPSLIEQVRYVLSSTKTFAATFINEMNENLLLPEMATRQMGTSSDTAKENVEVSTKKDDTPKETVSDLTLLMKKNKIHWFPKSIKRKGHSYVLTLYCEDVTDHGYPGVLPEVVLESNIKSVKVKKVKALAPHLIKIQIKSKKKMPKLNKVLLHVNQESSNPSKIVLVVNKTK